MMDCLHETSLFSLVGMLRCKVFNAPRNKSVRVCIKLL
jgi:negative regulator of genetic competence, sporulation and motility